MVGLNPNISIYYDVPPRIVIVCVAIPSTPDVSLQLSMFVGDSVGVAQKEGKYTGALFPDLFSVLQLPPARDNHIFSEVTREREPADFAREPGDARVVEQEFMVETVACSVFILHTIGGSSKG